MPTTTEDFHSTAPENNIVTSERLSTRGESTQEAYVTTTSGLLKGSTTDLHSTTHQHASTSTSFPVSTEHSTTHIEESTLDDSTSKQWTPSVSIVKTAGTPTFDNTNATLRNDLSLSVTQHGGGWSALAIFTVNFVFISG